MRLRELVVLAGMPDLSTFHLIQPLRILGGSLLGGVLFVRSMCTCMGWCFLGIECTCCHRFVTSQCDASESRID